MYGILLRDFFSVLLMGFTIKFLDDIIDADTDKISGKHNFWNDRGTGIIPYAFLLFSLSVALNRDLSVPLFISAYVVGMSKQQNQKYLLGLPGWAESLLVMAVSLLLFSWFDVLTSLVLLLALQFIDDYLDYPDDLETGEKNFFVILGFWEAVIGCGILLTALLFYSPYKLFLVMLAYLSIIIIVEKKLGKRAFECFQQHKSS